VRNDEPVVAPSGLWGVLRGLVLRIEELERLLEKGWRLEKLEERVKNLEGAAAANVFVQRRAPLE